MARYERGDDFWVIERAGTQITITAGTIGTAGETTVEQMASQKLAETRWNVLLNQQARAGFTLYRPPVEPPPPGPTLPPAPIVHDARNAELERAIVEDPENDSLYEVYGDWLQGQGDPRGKLIALELATRDKLHAERNQGALDRFVKLHHDYLYAGFPTTHERRVMLAYGFLRQLDLYGGRLTEPLAKILALPGSRFVTRISIAAEFRFEHDDIDAIVRDFADAIAVLATHAPPTLRHLELAGGTDSLDALTACLPRLRSFTFMNGDHQLAVSRRCLRTLVRSPWPHLEKLTLELLLGDCSFEDLAPLLARSDLPKLTELRFRTPFDDAIAQALVTSRLASQLTHLSFQELGGRWTPGKPIGDPFAEMMVANSASFPRLVELDVPVLRFSPAAVTSLEIFGVTHGGDAEEVEADEDDPSTLD